MGAWVRVGEGRDVSEFARRFKRRAKFLIDENVDSDVTEWLRSEGWNVRDVFDLGIAGRDDWVVYQAARDYERMLVTHDYGFFDNRQFPLRLSPGVLLIPGGSGNYAAMARAVLSVVRVIAPFGEVWKGTKIEIHSDSEVVNIKIVSFVRETGRTEMDYFRLNGEITEKWTT